jgi:ergothioneine biosynthesis protein EgtB
MDARINDQLFVVQPAEQQQGMIIDRFLEIRRQTESLAAPLSEADAQLQSMPDVSPAKWHLAHTTWFFETFILCEHTHDYQRFNESFNYLFNSYYNGIGEQYPRHQRGLISRPSLQEVVHYRHFIDDAMCRFLLDLEKENKVDLLALVELGLQHEQQHQELLLTDIKHSLFHNPLYPVYQSQPSSPVNFDSRPLEWLPINGGLASIGYEGEGFSYDNERPNHMVYLHEYALASRLVTNGEYAEFIDSGGYSNPDYWLADGWSWLQESKHEHPLYWLQKDNKWYEYTLYGLLPLDEHQPVIHVNYYEANAYANWLGVRLPTEFEWEHAVQQYQVKIGLNQIHKHPSIDSDRSSSTNSLAQAFTQGWQWTSSHYAAYPGFSPFSGVAGEYNGKFMSNQYVLRGSSCVTPTGHARLSYRNFFYAHQNWQFTTIRLAK